MDDVNVPEGVTVSSTDASLLRIDAGIALGASSSRAVKLHLQTQTDGAPYLDSSCLRAYQIPSGCCERFHDILVLTERANAEARPEFPKPNIIRQAHRP